MEKLTGLSFLIADRHQPVRAIIRHVLNGMGSRAVSEASEGTGIVELIERTGPDVVIVDFRLPGLDGIELARQLRRLPDDRVRRTGVVLLAAGATPELVREARNGGVDEFLLKPFSAEGLQKRVRAAAFHRREFIVVATYVGPCRRRFVDPLFDGSDRRHGDDLRVPTAIARMAQAQHAR